MPVSRPTRVSSDKTVCEPQPEPRLPAVTPILVLDLTFNLAQRQKTSATKEYNENFNGLFIHKITVKLIKLIAKKQVYSK